MKRVLSVLLLLPSLAFSTSGEVSKMDCPAGYVGNLLDKFTGSYGTDDGQFSWSGERRKSAPSIVSGNAFWKEKKRKFNLSIPVLSTYSLEIENDRDGFDIYTGSVCGYLNSSGGIEILLIHSLNVDLDTIQQRLKCAPKTGALQG